MTRLQQKYIKEVVPAMEQRFGYRNAFQVPRLVKVVVNCGIGQALKDDKFTETVVKNLTRITGQKPVLTKSRKSIAAFKIRAGMNIGVMVTLRGNRMYDFVDKLINVALPRTRDFQGIERSCVDQTGNLNLGFKEHIVFPEIRSDEVERIHGLQVTIALTAKSQAEGLELFTLLGVPFKKS